MTVHSDLLWAAGILGFLGASLLLTKALTPRLGLQPETTRKMVHMLMGLAVLPFPYVFTWRYTVALMGAIALAAMGLLRLTSSRQNLGDVLYNVGRTSSVGELVYPVGIVSTYYVAKEPLHFVIPILVLAFSDSLAALVGSSYARRKLSHEREDNKSAEGAVAFFASAFFCTVAPLLLLSTLPGPVILYTSLIVASVAACLELVCSLGLDNLVIPFVSATLLGSITSKPEGELLFYIAAFAGFITVALIGRRMTNLTILGTVLALLVGFLTTVLGSLFWVAAPLIQFATYALFPRLSDDERKAPLHYHALLPGILPGLLVVVLGTYLQAPQRTFWIYFTCYACMLAINDCSRMYNHHPQRYPLTPVTSTLKGMLLEILPAALLFPVAFLKLAPLFYPLTSALAIVATVTYCHIGLRHFHFPVVSVRHAYFNAAGVGVIIAIQTAALVLYHL